MYRCFIIINFINFKGSDLNDDFINECIQKTETYISDLNKMIIQTEPRIFQNQKPFYEMVNAGTVYETLLGKLCLKNIIVVKQYLSNNLKSLDLNQRDFIRKVIDKNKVNNPYYNANEIKKPQKLSIGRIPKSEKFIVCLNDNDINLYDSIYLIEKGDLLSAYNLFDNLNNKIVLEGQTSLFFLKKAVFFQDCVFMLMSRRTYQNQNGYYGMNSYQSDPYGRQINKRKVNARNNEVKLKEMKLNEVKLNEVSNFIYSYQLSNNVNSNYFNDNSLKNFVLENECVETYFSIAVNSSHVYCFGRNQTVRFLKKNVELSEGTILKNEFILGNDDETSEIKIDDKFIYCLNNRNILIVYDIAKGGKLAELANIKSFTLHAGMIVTFDSNTLNYYTPNFKHLAKQELTIPEAKNCNINNTNNINLVNTKNVKLLDSQDENALFLDSNNSILYYNDASNLEKNKLSTVVYY